jgi:hypothetical protein
MSTEHYENIPFERSISEDGEDGEGNEGKGNTSSSPKARVRMRGREMAFMLVGGLFGVRGFFFWRRDNMPGKPGLLVLERISETEVTEVAEGEWRRRGRNVRRTEDHL